MSLIRTRRGTILLATASTLLLLLALGGWFLAKRQKASARGEAISVDALQGKPAPEFVLLDLEGRTLRLSDLRGKAVQLNFWATWCGPCRLEMPWLSELHDKYASQGFEVVGISTEGEDLKPRDENGRARQRNAVREFVAEMSPDYPILLNGDSISHAYGGLDSLPTSFFLNKDGVVVASQIGIRSESDIETNIRKALGLSTQAHETSQP